MIVKELIAALSTLPPNQEVVTDLHSELSVVTAVELVVGYDNGGYVSAAYDDESALKEHGYVFVGVDSTNNRFRPWSERTGHGKSIEHGRIS